MICELPDDLLHLVVYHVNDTNSNNALRLVNRKFRDLTECSVYANKSLKYILNFYLSDVIIKNPQYVPIGSIKTLFPGYTRIFIKEKDKIITKLYTPRICSVREIQTKGPQKITITKKHDFRTGYRHEEISIQEISTNTRNIPDFPAPIINNCLIS